MGYTARQVESSIFIAKEDVERLSETLEQEHAWNFIKNNDGDIIEFYFVADKPKEEDIEFLKTIAPHVQDYSFVELLGEDGLRWRWVMAKSRVYELRPEIQWKVHSKTSKI